MTATAFAFDPALDLFDDVDRSRPELRLIEGEGMAAPLAPTLDTLERIELGRRRRFLALVAVTALILVTAWAAGISLTSFGAVAPAASTDAAPSVLVVHPGDSYGAMAAELGAANPIAAAEVLRAANGGAELVVGERLVIDAALSSAVHQAGA